MRVGIIQSSYLPWRGYFDFIASVDLFVFLDDVQYTRRDWRNRNRLKTPQGSQWISVPVHFSRKAPSSIEHTPIDWSLPWPQHHRAMLTNHYRGQPGLDDALQLLAPLADTRHTTISALNIALIDGICGYLGITTPRLPASRLQPTGTKTERLLCILERLGADTYLSGPSAAAYLDSDLLLRHGITVEYKRYDYPTYPQPWPPFDPQLSIIDTIACLGPQTRQVLHSLSPDLPAHR